MLDVKTVPLDIVSEAPEALLIKISKLTVGDFADVGV